MQEQSSGSSIEDEMNYTELEKLLDSGGRVGFIKPTDSPDYLGWILIAKIEANRRLLELVTEAEAPALVQEERRRLVQPYMVLQIELKRSIHEAGEYETESDYRQKERLWFGDLEAVAEQLRQWGYELQDARSARELDAP